MRLSDTFSGLLLVLCGLAVAIVAARFPAAPGQSIGPGVFPILAGLGLASCGIVLARAGGREPGRAWLEVEDWVRRPRLVLNAALVIGALVFYALAADRVGFFLAAFLFLAALLLAFKVRWRWVAPVALAVTLGLHVVFYTLLRVPLPWGWMEGIAW